MTMLRLAIPMAGLGLLAGCGEGQIAPEAMIAQEAPQLAVQQGGVELIAEPELAAMLAEDRVLLVDVRTPEEFAEGHIAGAVNMPVESFDPSAVPTAEDKETILYCRSARRSERAAEMLADHSGGTVRHLEGGILAWQDAGGEVVVP